MDEAEVAGYDVEQTLDVVEAPHRVQVEAAARMFVLAAHFADLHDEHTAHGRGPVLTGTERALRLDGQGTPSVAEFAAAELGARMRMGRAAAEHYLADALDVRHRLHGLWSGVRSGQVKVAWARLVAAKTRHLPVAAAAVVDARLAPYADGRLP